MLFCLILYLLIFFLCVLNKAGKRIISLTVDGEFIYWIMKTKDDAQIYQAKKGSGAILSQVKASRSKHILAYSSALQPFPGNSVAHTACLFPSKAVCSSSLCIRLSFHPTFCQACLLLTLFHKCTQLGLQ